MEPLFVVLEGLDGTGKSTLARALARELDAELLSTPPAELKPARPRIDAAYARSGLAGQLFYASTVAFVSEQVRGLLASGRSVVVDRYWLSTWAYNVTRRGAIKLDEVERVLLPADHTLLIEAREPERRHRLLARGACPQDLRALRHSDALRKRFRQGLKRDIAGVGSVLDTTQLSPTEACAAALQLINRVPVAA